MPELEKIEEKLASGEDLTTEEKNQVLGAPDTEVEEEQLETSKKIAPEEADDEDADDDQTDTDEDTDEEDSAQDDVDDEPEAKLSEKDATSAEAKKKEADDAALKEAERNKLIEKESEKPLDEVDIENYSPTERALFFELRKERRKRQDAQRETDTLRFRDAQEKKTREIEERKKAEAAEKDPFDGLDEDEILTVGQIKKVLTTIKPRKEEDPGQYQDPVKNKLLMDNWILRGQQKHADLLQVLDYAQDVLGDDATSAAEVQEVITKGGNAAIATYKLIKAHHKWAKIEAELKAKNGGTDEQKKKEEEARTNKERAERIEKNKKKPVMTGSGGGAGKTGDYTAQEILNMSEAEFAKLPKATREKILKAL